MLVAPQRALHKHSVISCAIAKGGALRERGYVRTSGGSISLVGNGIAYNEKEFAQFYFETKNVI